MDTFSVLSEMLKICSLYLVQRLEAKLQSQIDYEEIKTELR